MPNEEFKQEVDKELISAGRYTLEAIGAPDTGLA
jgi:hypothetical protein